MKKWVKFIVCIVALCPAVYAIVRGAYKEKYEEEQQFKLEIHGSVEVKSPDMNYLSDEREEEVEEVRGYACTRLNVRTEPNTESEVLTVLRYGEFVSGQASDGWIDIGSGFVCMDYIVSEVDYIDYELESCGFKSYMPYEVDGNSLFGKKTKQYKIQELAWTDSHGMRVVSGRYCVAIGSYFTIEVGQYFDLILENGTVIPCILADGKADYDTDEENIFTEENGCVSEFIVDVSALDKEVRLSGDISNIYPEWDSPVVKIRVYEENILK